jgi:peptidoglycan/xylan/chitin deacetylase (PgdA/CDA1 family)
MKVKRIIKTSLLYILKFLGVFKLCRYLTGNSIRIVGYHYVSIHDEHTRFPSLFLDKASFERRLEFINKKFKVITLNEAVNQIESRSIKRNQVVLTFDDGLYNFKKSAVPLLRKHRNPATLYVVSDYMLSGLPVVTMILRDILLKTNLTKLTTEFYTLETPVIISAAEGQRKFLDWAVRFSDGLKGKESKLSFIKEVSDLLGVNSDQIIANRYWHAVSVNEVVKLADDGFDIQPHGHKHTDVLGAVSDVRANIETCINNLELLTQKPARDYCYPVGLWSKAVWPLLEQLGVRSSVTTLNGPNFVETPLYALRRIMDGEDRTQLEFEFEMSFLKWMIRLPFSPSLLYQPSEKLVSYKTSGKGF